MHAGICFLLMVSCFYVFCFGLVVFPLFFCIFFFVVFFAYWWFKWFFALATTEAAALASALWSMSLIQSTNFPRINPKMAIAMAIPIYLIGSCCWANCGGEYGFWNAADVSFFEFISFSIRNRKISSWKNNANKI